MAQNEVDLDRWQSQGAGVWTIAPDGLSVLQELNGGTTFFCSDFQAVDTVVVGRLKVEDFPIFNDNDFVGFALGFDRQDFSSVQADYLLIDWKQEDQVFTFVCQQTLGRDGLAVSRVSGKLYLDEFWSHTDLTSPPCPMRELPLLPRQGVPHLDALRALRVGDVRGVPFPARSGQPRCWGAPTSISG